ncbi:protein pob, putative [Ichthyophthirius multifiliis]|uniref:ER membrane protein complex subunit 3 n=1 Tax=Ichthyophthirius multifiliis TaxID=5932 RepID=G0R6E5_ICHMU|nr:protein pob, putative [Ichthyophthirius multifiliis]EGR26945.1 protein pob, putative [Ichthyophthirius multifiliis]|eukprot:XP_004023829.1 protein pob, putative [Ichthyophthirius multifiliis]
MDTVIDHRIRDWVFSPIVIVMFMVNLFRHYLSIYSEKKTIEKISALNEYLDICDKQQIVRCQNIIKHNSLLTDNSFKIRKYHLCKKNGGYLTVRGERVTQVNPMQQMAQMNPNNMTAMLKNNLSMGLSTFLLYTWVNQLFSGFILARVPFPLTQKFRIMLQSGVDILNLNVRYVSSLSLYFYYQLLFFNSKLQYRLNKNSQIRTWWNGSYGRNGSYESYELNVRHDGRIDGWTRTRLQKNIQQ